jgi:hypothetical protein
MMDSDHHEWDGHDRRAVSYRRADDRRPSFGWVQAVCAVVGAIVAAASSWYALQQKMGELAFRQAASAEQISVIRTELTRLAEFQQNAAVQAATTAARISAIEASRDRK